MIARDDKVGTVGYPSAYGLMLFCLQFFNPGFVLIRSFLMV